MVAVRDGADPEQVEVRVRWADAATRSVAQEADAAVELFMSGLVSAPFALPQAGLHRRRDSRQCAPPMTR